MPDLQFTKAQSAAICHHDGDLLVSAGAGSGKTRALTEKVARYLIAHPDKDATAVLVVTFTNAAAAELRERIAKRLGEAIADTDNRHALYRQIASLERAPISTIHSFCLRILRPRAASLGLPPDFAVADTGVAAALRASAMNDAVEESFGKSGDKPEKAAAFRELADLVGSARNGAQIESVLLSFAEHLRETSTSPAALREMATRRGEEADTGVSAPDDGLIAALAGSFAAYYGRLFSRLIEEMKDSPVLLEKYVPIASEYVDFCARLEKISGKADAEAIRLLLRAADLPNLRSARVKDEDTSEAGLFFKAERSAFQDRIGDLLGVIDYEPTVTAEDARRIARLEGALADVIERFEAHYTAEKQRRGLVDYSDLEAMTYALLVSKDGEPTPAAAEIASNYERIFVDEYQDTNRVQDAIFRAIAKAHDRFLVGDVKQSIYGFRGAEPSLFSDYRRTFPALDPELPEESLTGDASVFMSDNFRCDKPIIDFSNIVSDTIFPSGNIDYQPDDRLICRKKNADGTPVEIVIVRKGEENEKAEAAYVARRIREMLKSGKKDDGSPVAPSDIAILLRSLKKSGAVFRTALEKEGIPVSGASGNDFFREPEILLALSLLSAVDNPTRDVPLAGALKSPLFGFTMDDLARLRQKTPRGALWDALSAGTEHDDEALAGKCRAAAEQLTRYRRMSRGMPSDKLIEAIYRDTAITARATAPGTDGDGQRANLHKLYDMARQYESAGFGGLFGFLRHIERLIDSDDAKKIAVPARDGAVRILSIHESKGLEFPVVFVSRASKGFNLRDANDALLFEPDVGVSMKLADETGLVLCDTRQRQCAAQRMRRRAKEEEMRILYVAMTRARERLIITGEEKEPEDLIRKTEQTIRFAAPSGAIPSYLVHSASSHLDWIVLAAAAHPDDSSFVLLTADAPTEDDAAEDTAVPSSPIDEALAARLDERFNFRYPYEDIARLPAKLIVSRLHPGIIDPDEPEDEVYTATGRFLSASDVRPEPSFLSGMPAHTAADVGIATHAFFEFCRLDALAEDGGIDRELARLVAEEYITEKMASLVRRDQIEAFRASSLYARMRRAREIKKEFRFYAAVPADTLTNDPAVREKLRAVGADVLVQGVVDCFFEDADGKIVLVDYKTDRLSPAELADRSLAEKKLRERHTDQLTYYRKATEKMLGRPVDEVVVYSLPLGDTVEIR